MTPDDFKTYSTIGLGLWNAVLTLVLWLRKPGEEAGAAVDVLREDHGQQLGEIRKDVAKIQTELEHMPTSEELAQLEGTVKQIAERTVAMADSMATVRSAVGRIETFLLNAKS